jgi:hypothetical protein
MVNVELSGEAANNDSGPFIGCAGLSGLSRSSNHLNQKNQTDEMNQRDQMHQLPATRREMGSGVLSFFHKS